MKKLISETDVINYLKTGVKTFPVGKDEIITPLAMDKIKSSGLIIIEKSAADKIEHESDAPINQKKTNKIVIGNDHTGFQLKQKIINYFTEKKYEIIDVGTYDEKSCDYPDFASAVARKVKEGTADFGVIIDATGIPSAITANKLPGIRAATCYNEFSARSAREHNNANILVLGAMTLGEGMVISILDIWLNTYFGGGRHQKRLNKITSIENEFMK